VDGFAATALSLAETAFPVLRAAAITEPAPLARPPQLPDVPTAGVDGARRNAGGIALAAVTMLAGATGLRRGRRPQRRGGAAS
jgi:hypothetical protein